MSDLMMVLIQNLKCQERIPLTSVDFNSFSVCSFLFVWLVGCFCFVLQEGGEGGLLFFAAAFTSIKRMLTCSTAGFASVARSSSPEQ